jgi:hypothetical protein
MADQDVVKRLRDSDTPDALHSLASQLADETLDAPKAIVRLWATGDRAVSEKAGSVVLDLEEFAVRPMLGESDSSPLTWRLRFMHAAVETELHLRTLVLKKLDGQLGDATLVPGSELTESLPPGAKPVRVCDEAYVWVRRLVSVSDPKDGFGSERDFLNLGHPERSKEIQRWKRSPVWAEVLSADLEPEKG